jgi:hypothetical protein
MPHGKWGSFNGEQLDPQLSTDYIMLHLELRQKQAKEYNNIPITMGITESNCPRRQVLEAHHGRGGTILGFRNNRLSDLNLVRMWRAMAKYLLPVSYGK